LTGIGGKRTLSIMRNAYPANRLGLRLAFRPLAHMFEFSGRSTRTEVVSFWLFDTICHVSVVTVTGVPPQLASAIGTVWAIAWSWPWIPLLVRRLHDQDRSGGWSATPLVGIVLFAMVWCFAPSGDGPTLQLSLGWIDSHRSIAWSPLTIATGAAAVVLSITMFLLYLMPPTAGANRFGPNPRLNPEPDTAGEAIPAET